MAGPLTWRDVTAPDFSSAMQGVGQFSQMLGNALGGADKALTEWDDTKTEEVSRDFMLELFNKYQTPEAFAAAQADGTLMDGVDTNRLNPGAMEFLFGRPDALLDTEGKQLTNKGQGLVNEGQALDNTIRTKEFGWKETDRASVDAAKPYAFQMLQTVTAPGKDGGEPTQAEINERMAVLQRDPGFATVMGNLTPDQQMSMFTNPTAVLKGTLGIRSDRQGIRDSDFNYEKGKWEFQAAQADRADQTVGMAAAQEAIEGGGGDVETARGILAKKGLTPGAFAVAMNQITGTYGNVYAPDAYGGDPAAPGGGPGGAGAPIAGSDPGYTHPLQGRGTTVRGGEWGASRSYGGHTGVDYADKPGTAVYAAGTGVVVKSYFDPAYGNRVEVDHGGGRITTYSHMDGRTVKAGDRVGPDTRLGGVGNTGSASRGPHLHFEGLVNGQKVNPASLRLGGVAPQRDTLDGQAAISQGNTTRDSQGWASRLTDTSNAEQVSSALRAGPMKDVPAAWLSNKLNEMVRASGGRMNYAQAGRELHNSMTVDPSWYSRNAPTWLGGGYGDSRDRMNTDYLDQRIQDAASGKYGDQTRSDTSIANALQVKQVADAEYQAAWSERQKYMRAVASNPKAKSPDREARINARLDAAIQQRNAANQAYDMTVAARGGGTAPGPAAKPAPTRPWSFSDMFTIHRD